MDEYWSEHHKFANKGRLAWYAEPADQGFWAEHWQTVVTPEHYAQAAARPLEATEYGAIVAQHARKDGLSLEAGCGSGWYVAAMHYNGYPVEGIEYADDLVAMINKVQPDLPVRWGDALAIDRPDNHYDTYISFGVVEHRRDGPEPFLKEAYRVLKPGGKIVISVPHFGLTRRLKSQFRLYASEEPNLEFFQYGFSTDEYVRHLTNAGFKILEVHYLSVHRLLMEEVPLYRWLTRRRGERLWKQVAQKFLENRDGHMIMVVGQK